MHITWSPDVMVLLSKGSQSAYKACIARPTMTTSNIIKKKISIEMYDALYNTQHTHTNSIVGTADFLLQMNFHTQSLTALVCVYKCHVYSLQGLRFVSL